MAFAWEWRSGESGTLEVGHGVALNTHAMAMSSMVNKTEKSSSPQHPIFTLEMTLCPLGHLFFSLALIRELPSFLKSQLHWRSAHARMIIILSTRFVRLSTPIPKNNGVHQLLSMFIKEFCITYSKEQWCHRQEYRELPL